MKLFKYILIGLSIINTPLKANSINTTSNSSGSVVNQAVQVVPSRQFQYTMNGISCQGATLNISPFVSTTYGYATPYEPYFDRPIYSTRDIEGDSFMYYETLETPGITNYTHIQRTQTIENITDSTSTFSQ